MFLILPERINKLTGLRVPAATVMSLAVNATADFLDGRIDLVLRRAERYDPEPAKEGMLSVRDPTTVEAVEGEIEEVKAREREEDKARVSKDEHMASPDDSRESRPGRTSQDNDDWTERARSRARANSTPMQERTERPRTPRRQTDVHVGRASSQEAIQGMEVGQVPMPFRPVGKPGTLMYHPFKV